MFYSPIDLKRRFLYYPEGAALQSDGVGVAVLRSLLTENVVVHETVIDGQWQRLEKEGPTGAIIATSRVALDADLENRLDRVEISDTADQTRAIIDAIGASAEYGHWEPPEVDHWHAYYNWLRLQGPYEVIIPYASALAAAIPAAAIRLRRDVPQLFGLIWAHTVMHLPGRERDSKGRLVATLADYSGVRTLVNAGIGIATGRSVPTWMHETWEALPDEGGITYRELGGLLNMGDDGAKKRVEKMIPLGFADNLETRPRAAARLIRKTKPPERDATGFLPTANEIATRPARTPPPGSEIGQAGSAQKPGEQGDFTSDSARSDSPSDSECPNPGARSDSTPDRSQSNTRTAPDLTAAQDPTDPTDRQHNEQAEIPDPRSDRPRSAVTTAAVVHINGHGGLASPDHDFTDEEAVLGDAEPLVASGQPRRIDAPPLPRLDDTAHRPGCSHTEQWRARDGNWRCTTCEPAAFAAEVIDTKTIGDAAAEAAGRSTT